MTPETAKIFMFMALLWSVAIAIKAFQVVKSGGKYTFSFWDGGLLRTGKTLGAAATKAKAVVSAILALLVMVVIGGGMMIDLGFKVMIGLIVVTLIIDFAGTES